MRTADGEMADEKQGHSIARRVVTALSAAAGVVALFLWCPLRLMAPILMLLSALVQLEFYQIAAKRGYDPVPRFGILLGTLWIAFTAAFPGQEFFAGCAAYGVMAFGPASFLFSVYVMLRSSFAKPIGTIAVTLLGFFYVPFLISFFLRIVQFSPAPGPIFSMPDSRVGLYTLFALLAATKLSDMGGFAFGLAFGRHKMCPSISPKKSWEGFAGSVVGATLMALLFRWIAVRRDWAVDCAVWDHVTVPVAVAVGVTVAVVGTLGDLVESRFKRECGVKDSATFMPAGMGGFLDMFDSILFVPAVFYPVIVHFSR